MSELYTSLEMREAVRKFFEKDGFKFYQDYDPDFEPARVPVFGYKNEKREEIKEVFIDIITEPTIRVQDYFADISFKRTKDKKEGRPIKDASSAGFYRHYFPNASVYWAIPSYVFNDDELEQFKKKCSEEGIGILVVSKETNTENNRSVFLVKKINEACSLIHSRLKALSKLLNEDIKVETGRVNEKRILDILNDFSDDDLSYLVFYPEPKYNRRDISTRETEKNISKELILKMGALKKVSYQETLNRFSQEYNRRIDDDYKLALEITAELWNRYNVKFPRLHIDYEAVLKLDPKYRDHFLHSFQVFLYGVYIIDNMYDEINKKIFKDEDGKRIEDAWIIASTYHDFNYMVQNFDDWSIGFFENSLHIKKKENSPASIDLSKCYVKEDYMFKTRDLVKTLGLTKVDRVTLDFLYDRILDRKNHGVLSALSLLKYLENFPQNSLSENVILSAAKAISLHDWQMWGFFSGIANTPKKKDPFGFEFKKKKILEKLTFKKDPISFLLILGDSLQEEGRESEEKENLGEIYIKSNAELETLYLLDEKIYTEISFKGTKIKSNEKFKEKIDQLENVCDFLSGNKQFIILLKDGNSEQTHQFTI